MAILVLYNALVSDIKLEMSSMHNIGHHSASIK